MSEVPAIGEEARPTGQKRWHSVYGAACLLLVFDLLAPLIDFKTRPQFFLFATVVLVTVQVALHSAWVVLGPGRFWWRIASIPLAAALMVWISYPFHPQYERPGVQVFYFEHWGLVAACLFPLRALEYRVRPVPPASAVTIPNRQFSISYLFGLVTVASFVIAMGTGIEDGRRFALEPLILIMNAFLLLITVPPVLAVLMPRDPWPAILAAFFLPTVVLVALTAGFAGNSELGELLILTNSLSFVEICLLGLIRRDGYRLQRARPAPQATFGPTPADNGRR